MKKILFLISFLCVLLAGVYARASQPLVMVRFSPSQSHVGEAVSAFVTPKTDFVSHDAVFVDLRAKLDGVDTELLNSGKTLWVGRLGAFQTVGSHTLEIDTYIGDKEETKAARDELSQVWADIQNFQNAISHEQDPDRKAQLQSELAAKESRKAELEQILISLEKLLASDSFSFSVASAPAPSFSISDGPIYNFGTIQVGAQMPTHTFIVSNSGTASGVTDNLTTDSLGLTGTPFSFQGGSCGPSLPIPPGGTCSFTIGLSTSSAGSPDSTMHVAMSNAQLLQVELKGTVNGALPVVKLSTESDSFTEGDAAHPAKITLILLGNTPDAQIAKVHYTLTGSVDPSRYTIPTSGELQTWSGTPGAYFTEIGLINDSIHQGDQTIIVTIDSVTSGNAQLASPTVETITIHDDDLPLVDTTRADKIVVGQSHTCALSMGRVKCWGDNSQGQLGNGSIGGSSNIPTEVTGLGDGVVDVVAGSNHSCALKAGFIYCWGAGASGQLGNGDTSNSGTPAQINWLGYAHQISAGDEFTCFIQDGGQAYCFGRNDQKQLGSNAAGANASVSTPTPVGNSSGNLLKVTSLSAGGNHACAMSNAQLWCWGASSLFQYGTIEEPQAGPYLPTHIVNGDGAQQVAAGHAHSCFIRSARLFCSGAYQRDDLVLFDFTDMGSTYQGANFVSAGTHSTCVSIDGKTKCFGESVHGNLGDGDTTTHAVAYASPITNANSHKASLRGDHSCILFNGRALCVGRNDLGQTGAVASQDVQTPAAVYGLSQFSYQAVSADTGHTCAVINGAAKCWGQNDHGQLGNGNTTESHVPVQVLGLESGVTNIQAGFDYSCAIKDGAAYCWGNAHNGTLGNNVSSGDFTQPVLVQGFDSGVTDISVNGSTPDSWHTCAIRNGGAYCWGSNAYAQIGNGSQGGDILVPTAVSGLNSGVITITAGWGYSCANQNYSLKCWGYNGGGQLGAGTTTSSELVPVLNLAPSPVVKAEINNDHGCAISYDGTYCWGQNYSHQLGLGPDITPQFTPLKLNGIDGASEIVTGGDTQAAFSCAVNRGDVLCWGDDSKGQMGSGQSAVGFDQPTNAVTGITGVRQISAGEAHACAVANGIAYCWGLNDHGQLGNGDTNTNFEPVAVQGLTNLKGGRK